MNLLFALGASLATMLILVIVFGYVFNRQIIKQRFGTVVGPQDGGNSAAGWRTVVRQLSVYFESSSWAKQQEDLLMQAGIPFRGAEFMVISLAISLFSMVLILMLLGVNILVGVGTVVGFFVPKIVVKRKISKKKAQVNEQLPDALVLMANSLRSGYSYLQAVDLVSKEMPAPLSEEFGFVVKEMNLGISTEEAFTNLVKRVNTEDLDLTVTAFLIQRQVGGNLAELLDNIAETIRSRVRMKERISTLTAQGKLSGFILCGLPVFMAIALYVVNRGYIMTFFRDPLGLALIVAGIALQIIGIFWMRNIINIDV